MRDIVLNRLSKRKVYFEAGEVVYIIADDLIAYDDDHVYHICFGIACGEEGFFALLSCSATIGYYGGSEFYKGIQLSIEPGGAFAYFNDLIVGEAIHFA